jgi:NADP-dependent 3-hydroxy acid dehydrogenase YdfG
MIGFDLTGRAGIVTGAGKGIGEATALELAALGARVVACARTESDLEKLVATIKDGGGQATGMVADVRRFEDMTKVAQTCKDEYGSIDFVVANAGMDVEDDMVDGDPKDWRAMVETNVLGMAHTIRAALPTMREQGSGHVVITGSVSGRITYVGEPMYIASKWAVTGMGGALRREALEYGVRVTIIEPGLVDTPMIHALPSCSGDLDKMEALLPEDCAHAVAYALCQPRRVNITSIAMLPLEQSAST